MTNEIAESTESFVTVMTAGQLFGLKLGGVRDVFVPRGLAKVPLAPPEIAGVLNLRGRIVTAIDLRARLGLPARAEGAAPLAVGTVAADLPDNMFDAGAFLASCRNDRAFAEEMIALFLEAAPDQVAALREEVEAGRLRGT